MGWSIMVFMFMITAWQPNVAASQKPSRTHWQAAANGPCQGSLITGETVSHTLLHEKAQRQVVGLRLIQDERDKSNVRRGIVWWALCSSVVTSERGNDDQ